MNEADEQSKWDLHVDDSGILYIVWHSGVVITEEDARAAVNGIREVTEANPKPLLVNVSGVESIERPARNVFLQSATSTRVALLGSSMVDRIVAAFYNSVSNSAATPTRFFTSREQAVQWLVEGQGPTGRNSQ